MDFELLKNTLKENSLDLSNEFKRVFHGRGNYYKDFEFLTIDSIDLILNIAFYNEIEICSEKQLLTLCKEYIKNTRHKTIILQRRYLSKSPSELVLGSLENENFAIENKLKFKLDLLSYQNNGYFADMKIGREFIEESSKDKNVLNLFSYTCGFSIASSRGDAKQVVNIDMSKGALTKGRTNHHINDISTSNIKFFPYNILKSFSRIKKFAPYDIIIIDPPTFQKGSFEASKDYEKIIKKIDLISSTNCILLTCLNSPHLNEEFLISMITQHTKDFTFQKRLKDVENFKNIDSDKSLKNLVFTNFK